MTRLSAKFRLTTDQALFLGFILIALAAFPVSAATIHVNTTLDNTTGGDGECTLREAVGNANGDHDTTSGDCAAGTGDDTIVVPAGTYAGTATLGITDTDPTTVEGAGAGSTVLGGANTAFAGTDVVVRGVTIEGGSTGFQVYNAAFALEDSRITGSTAGPGLWVREAGGMATVDRCLIDSNHTTGGFGGVGGGVYAITGTFLTAINSTITGNTAAFHGGGIYCNGTCTLINSTVTGNDAVQSAGGVGEFAGTIEFKNTIVSGNTAPTEADCRNLNGASGLTSLDHNVFGQNGSASGCPATGANDIVPSGAVATVLDATLAANGGETATHALAAGSPAIDSGDSAVCAAAQVNDVDQRGLGRPAGAGCDVGAYEAGATLPLSTIFNTGTAATPLTGTYGQKITMPAGSSYNNIRFGIYTQGNVGNANGSLYLLNQEYLGLPGDLSAATPGFIAVATSPVGNTWTFDPSVTLSAGTEYWFYNDTNSTWGDGASAAAVGGSEYRATGFASPGDGTYGIPSFGNGFAMNFLLEGLAVAAADVDLAVSKTESAEPVIAGSGAGNLTYTLTVTNNGPADATGVALSEDLTLPTGVSVDSVTPSAGAFAHTIAPDGTWTIGNLAGGASETLTVVLTADATAAAGTDVISSTAAVTAVNETDTDSANDSVTESTSIARETDLGITKTDGVTSAIPGRTVTYTISTSNAGPSDAMGATISDTFAADFAACDWTCAGAGGGVCAASGSGNIDESVDLPVGASVTLIADCTISATASGTLSNTATIAADAAATDPNALDNSATDDDTQLMPAVFANAVTHAAEGETVDVPIHLATSGASLGSAVFSIDYDESCLDPDADGDGTLDSVTVNTVHAPGDFAVTVLFDALDTDGEIDVSIADVSPPIASLGNGDLLTVRYAVTCPAVPVTAVDATMAFSLDPAATFGDTAGQDVLGAQVDGIVRIWPGPRGDCNGSDALGAADLTAVGLEIFDGDGEAWFEAPSPTFAGSPVGCDANASTLIKAGDVTCANQLIFGLDCTGLVETLTAPTEPPSLEIRLAADGEMVWIRARLARNAHAVGSVAFSLDLDPAVLPLGGIDANRDGQPDHLRFPNGTPGLAMATFNAEDRSGEVDVLLADLQRSPLAEGVLVEIGVPAALLQVPSHALRFSATPSPSFGSVTGADIDGVTSVEGATTLFLDSFESGTTDHWSRTVR